MKLADRVRAIVTDQLGVDGDALTPETLLGDDLTIDSLDAAELACALEEDLGVHLSETAMASLRTYADLVGATAHAVRQGGTATDVDRGTGTSIRGGILSVAGELEYSPRIARVDLKDLAVDGVEADYIRTIENAAAESRGTERAIEAAKQASNAPAVQVRAEQIRIRHGTLGFVNRQTEPAYRLFLADAGLTIRRLSNQRAAGPSFAQLRGRFMGSGDTLLRARFQPQTQAPDFDLDVSVEHADLRSLNDLLQAQGNFDVAAGELSVYSALRVRDLTVDGYVKPLLKGVRVYDTQQDRDKPFFHRLYERLVGLAATLLESRQRNEVATKVDLSGPLTEPRTSTWQIVGRLLQNALITPITPGLEGTPLDDVATASPQPSAARVRHPPRGRRPVPRDRTRAWT